MTQKDQWLVKRTGKHGPKGLMPKQKDQKYDPKGPMARQADRESRPKRTNASSKGP